MRVVLAEAALKDAKKVFDWRNAPESRRFSINAEKISWEDHQRWFAEVLADPNRHLFKAKSDGEEIGVLRLDVAGDAAEVSIYVIPGLAGHGLGTAILEAAIDWAGANLAVACLTAKVSAENPASVRLFIKTGFALIDETDGRLSFKKELRVLS